MQIKYHIIAWFSFYFHHCSKKNCVDLLEENTVFYSQIKWQFMEIFMCLLMAKRIFIINRNQWNTYIFKD